MAQNWDFWGFNQKQNHSCVFFLFEFKSTYGLLTSRPIRIDQSLYLTNKVSMDRVPIKEWKLIREKKLHLVACLVKCHPQAPSWLWPRSQKVLQT